MSMEQFNENFSDHVDEIMAAKKGDMRMREKHPDWFSQYDQLKQLLQKHEALSKEMRKEEEVCQQEREERIRLGLTGDAAIKHYNDFMHLHGMDCLMVKV